MNIATLIKNNERVQEIVQVAWKNDDWGIAYDLIFPTIMRGVRASDPDFEWCDPDASYQDDVLAFANALKERAERLQAFQETTSDEISVVDAVTEVHRLLNIIAKRDTGTWDDVIALNSLRSNEFLKKVMQGE